MFAGALRVSWVDQESHVGYPAITTLAQGSAHHASSIRSVWCDLSRVGVRCGGRFRNLPPLHRIDSLRGQWRRFNASLGIFGGWADTARFQGIGAAAEDGGFGDHQTAIRGTTWI